MTLIVPEYVLKQRQAKEKAEKEAKDKSLTERVPQPTGWRILVMPYMGKDKTEGGIYVPIQLEIERQELQLLLMWLS